MMGFQIGTDWQEGVRDPLIGEDEVSAREYINAWLDKQEVSEDNPNVNDYIMRAWDEWVSQQPRMKCPRCGSPRLHKAGFGWSGRTKRQCWRCQDCGTRTMKPRL